MQQKKLVYVFLILAFSFTLFLPVLNILFMEKNKKISLQNFSKQQLFSTDNVESLLNYFAYKTLHISLDKPQVIVGKDNFFFLGNSYSNIIDKSKGTFPYNRKNIDMWVNKINKLQNWYENQGIEFIFVIAPNKHTIYNDKLPNSVLYNEGKTLTDDIVSHAQDKNINIFNLKQILREKKQEKELFFHTDTHWNKYGAQIGYIETMRFLNDTYKKHYERVKYSINETIESGGGDLTNFLKINHFLLKNYEKDYHFTFTTKRKLCYGKINKNNILQECTAGIKNTFNQYTMNENAPNKKKLLYLSDSFGLANSSLYQETFDTVWRFHLSYVNSSAGILKNFIHEHKPDIVIYQVVERDLLVNYYNY